VEPLLLGIAVLACPIGMGLMMWMMMGRRRTAGGGNENGQDRVAQLRAEIEELKAERAEPSARGGA
jgi:hypothetical protein